MISDPQPRIVVTGASGFIGTHLVGRLRETGSSVVAVVRAEPTSCARHAAITYVARDLERIDTLEDVLRPDDVVVHLAARVHRMRDVGEGAEAAFRAANVGVMEMLCRSCAVSGVRRLVFLSSAKVFGEGRDEPYTRLDVEAPADAYARSKLEAEARLRSMADSGGFEWTIVRPPFVYGPGGKGNFPRLITLARLSASVPMPFASIDNRRSILFVGNLVDLILNATMHERASHRVLLPTDGRDVSTPELLRTIARASGSRARLFPCDASILRAGARLVGRSSDLQRLTESLRLDSAYLRALLDWSPPFPLDRAIALSVGGTAEA